MRDHIPDRHTLDSLKDWFDEYTGSFSAQDPDLAQNIALKEEHTRRVVREIVSLGTELGLDGAGIRLAELAALFHDIGRFEQYLRYRTFVDSASVDHASFGVEILRRHGVLAGLDPCVQELVLDVIACHNRAHLTGIEDPVRLFYSRLLRDADKLDIYRVVTGYYAGRELRKNRAIGLGLSDIRGISRDVFHSFMSRDVIRHEQLKTLDDFKLLQLAWIFDINFLPTLRRIRDRGYVRMILDALPDMSETREISLAIDAYMANPGSCLEVDPEYELVRIP